MVWLFERGDESLRLETRYERATADYVLIMHQPDGSEQVERFKDQTSFRTRLDALENQLRAELWGVVGSPVFLRDGWKVT